MSAQSRALVYLAVFSASLAATGCGGAQSRFAAHMQRGQQYFSQGDFVRASVEFRNALQIAPNNANARVMAGHAAEHLEQFRVAMSLYQSVVEATPQNDDARASLARLLIVAGLATQGMETLNPGLDQHPDTVELQT
jgi:Tfp pilus assembly protein PilF